MLDFGNAEVRAGKIERAPDVESLARKEHGREDVMLNHDEHANDISTKEKQVPAEHKTTEADSVENHQ